MEGCCCINGRPWYNWEHKTAVWRKIGDERRYCYWVGLLVGNNTIESNLLEHINPTSFYTLKFNFSKMKKNPKKILNTQYQFYALKFKLRKIQPI